MHPYIFTSINKSRFLILLLSIMLAACGGGSSSSGDDSPTVMTGQFIDSAVSGLRFQTATQSGYTNAAGNFKFIAGETVSFYIGDILLGSVTAKTQLTPIDLVSGAADGSDPQVQNLIRFIQSLDEDANPDNGITISNTITTFASGQTLDFTLDTAAFETAANTLLDYLTTGSVNQLISASDALDHLNLSLGISVVPGSLTLSGDDTSVYGDSFTPILSYENYSSSLGIRTISFQEYSSASVMIIGLNQTALGGTIATLSLSMIESVNNTIEIYSYKLETCMLPCSGMTLDLDAHSVSFDNLTVPISDLETSLATTAITLNGTLSWQ
jgi:hypothetical protein